MEVPVTYYMCEWFPNLVPRYTCRVKYTKVEQDTKIIKSFKGQHANNFSDKHVCAIHFENSGIDFIPLGLCEYFKNLQVLLIFYSNIKKIEKDDFIGYGQLKELSFNQLDVEYLPGNLLHNMPLLEIVSFQSCGIKYIDPEILDDVHNLKAAKFCSNISIDAFYDTIGKNKNQGMSLQQLKRTFLKLRPPPDYETYYSLPKCFSSDIKDFMKDGDKFKDLRIEFEYGFIKAHKFVLAARSSVLAEMIYKDPALTTLDFTDQIDIEIFHEILYYIYHDKFPAIKDNALDIFKAANRLGLEKLKWYLIKNMNCVTPDNAIDLLLYGNLYGNEKLKKQAFQEVNKMYPHLYFANKLPNNIEKVREIIGAKKLMDEKIRQAQEEFNASFLD